MAKWHPHRFPLLGSLIVRPRLAISAMTAASLFCALPAAVETITKVLASWDIGVVLYLVLTAIMMYGSEDKLIRKHAAVQDDGALVILCLTVSCAIASVAAIMRELVLAKTLSGHAEISSIALAACTVVLSWFFIQTIFALHYAHAYYSPRVADGARGLEFPAKYHTPDYWDFVYFSFVIGTAAATADINITSRLFRRIVTLQCIVVFFFNTSVLALAINVGAGLVS